jgi:hypothetical protein
MRLFGIVLGFGAFFVFGGGCQINRTIGFTNTDDGGVENFGPGWVDVKIATQDKIDILFMVDNSPSVPEQFELMKRFPALLDRLDGAAMSGSPGWYHIGVVTSDLGAGQFTLGSGAQCHPGGDGGRLQPRGAAADAACVRPVGLNFIDYNQLDGTNNLPAGQDLSKTFTCMASVGAMGCGFEHPLESVYRALHDPIPENQGFLRDDAVLAVFFLTDEDDCSADPTTDLFDPAKTSQYGLEHSFRCTRFGIACQGGLVPDADSGGPLANCHPATAAEGAKLIDVQKYVNFFTKPVSQGGVKVDPSTVILAALSGPSTPVVTTATVPCADAAASTCVVLDHSCSAPMPVDAQGQRLFFADPAIRLNTVIEATPTHQLTSICTGSYTTALSNLGDALVAARGGGCVTQPIRGGSGCVVADRLVSPDGTVQITEIPACASAPGSAPCWRLTTDAMCPAVLDASGQIQAYRLVIERGAVMPPAGTSTTARCLTGGA